MGAAPQRASNPRRPTRDPTQNPSSDSNKSTEQPYSSAPSGSTQASSDSTQAHQATHVKRQQPRRATSINRQQSHSATLSKAHQGDPTQAHQATTRVKRHKDKNGKWLISFRPRRGSFAPSCQSTRFKMPIIDNDPSQYLDVGHLRHLSTNSLQGPPHE